VSTHVHPVRTSAPGHPATAPTARLRATLEGPQVHVGADLRAAAPSAEDAYLPRRERRRRAAALLAALSATGQPPAAVLDRLGPRHRRALRRDTTLHLHVHGLEGLANMAAAGLATRGRLVVYVHDSPGWPLRTGTRATLRHRLVGSPLEHRLLDRADLIVAPGPRLADMLAGPAARPVLVVPPAPLADPVDLPETLPRPLPDLPGRRIVSVGPLVAHRGSGLLVEALRDQPEDTRLFLLGTGPDRVNIDRRARSAGVADRVHVLPTVSYGTVAAHLEHADVVASAAFVGDDSVPLLQAMRRGRPVVATRIEAMPQLVTDAVDGRLVAPVSADDLAATLRAVLTDPDQARSMGASARRRTAAAGWDAAARAIIGVLVH
jgi:glycosyltransferase involved in cell wall biosynthesis